MRRNFLFAVVGAVALLIVMQRAQAAFSSDKEIPDGEDVQPATADPNYWFLQDQSNVESVNMGSPENNLSAFLALIRKFETNDNYNIIYGGKTFDDFSAHPNVKVPIHLPGYEGKYSTAAGAYQFLHKTWKNLAAKIQVPDFSPESQDTAAIELLSEIGAMPAIQSGDFDEALRIASTRWASLPYSTAKQNPKTIAAANEFLSRYLESLA